MSVDESGFRRFLHALKEGRSGQCAAMVEHYLNRNLPVIDIYEHLFRPALYEIGELWAAERLPATTEHMVTGIIDTLMQEMQPRIMPAERKQLGAVVAAVEGETHQIGARMAADVFTMAGWRVRFLGTAPRTHELLRLIANIEPHFLCLSITVPGYGDALGAALDRLGGRFPELRVVIGGQGLVDGGPAIAQAFPRVIYIDTLKSLQSCIRRFEAGDQSEDPSPPSPTPSPRPPG
jgi:methylmalonyl-CoA mutase cobalamin-binding subunit